MASGTAIIWIRGRLLHFEVLIEDRSGSIALDSIMEKILGPNYELHSWRIIFYKGLGRIPRNMHGLTDPRKRILLDQLPRLLRGYGQSLADLSAVIVIVVVDLDDKDCMVFKGELLDVLNACNPRPIALFRIAIEESEAWLLGDLEAVQAGFPDAKEPVLNSYIQDSICGTWEVLADAVHPGGSKRLKTLGYPDIGIAKSEWAEAIAPMMDVDRNQSKSFQVFRDAVRRLACVGQESSTYEDQCSPEFIAEIGSQTVKTSD